jgi:hypothetical protein
MGENNKANNLICKGTLLLVALTSLFACSSSTTTLRIKTDPNRSVRDLVSPIQTEKPLQQAVLTAPSVSKETKEELLAEKVNRLLNHYVKSEELFAEGKLNEAEEEIIKGNSLVESKEGLSVLVKIYEQLGNKAKADSCTRMIKSLFKENTEKQPKDPN